MKREENVKMLQVHTTHRSHFLVIKRHFFLLDMEIANVAFYSSFNKPAHCSAMSQNYTVITHHSQNHLACLICFKNKVSM